MFWEAPTLCSTEERVDGERCGGWMLRAVPKRSGRAGLAGRGKVPNSAHTRQGLGEQNHDVAGAPSSRRLDTGTSSGHTVAVVGEGKIQALGT